MRKDVKWDERFNIGVDVVDQEHQKLFSIVRRLVNLSEDEKSRKWACAEGIKYFKYYTAKHFAQEERYMRSIGYSGYKMHKQLHDDLKGRTLPVLEKDLEESGYAAEAIRHFLGICVGWLTGHIILEDCAITGKIASRWGEAHPGEAGQLENALLCVIEDVFKQQAEVVSERYFGENFGDCLFCRMDYHTLENKQLHIFLAYEERLVFQTVGGMLGMKLKKVDSMVLGAARQLSRQLMKQVGAFFGETGKYQFEEDHILTREQFEHEFAAGYPPYSLLFDTGAGYLAFCAKIR
ncbi:hypothetical protein D7V86_04180 [bacterium D16-51]|nr:hypothetical protein D7V96_13775 [bacterium D16-59]RKI61726.1 hypothetical protein D7V86_04180 [bacterium D16-51]